MEPTPANGRHPARAALAALAVVALIAALAGVETHRQRHAPGLVLVPGGRAPSALPASAGVDFDTVAYRFRLAATPPDLGSAAPVGRLEPPAVDTARVRAMAAALGLQGAVRALPAGGGQGGGWQVVDGARRLTLTPTAGGWTVSEGAAAMQPGAVPGNSSGSVGSTGPGSPPVSTGSAAPAGSTVMPPVPLTPLAPPPLPTPVAPPPFASPPASSAPAPANLPSAVAAERIARTLLTRMGITGDWSATVDATTAGAVACAPQPCATPDVLVVTARSVELRPRFDGVAIDALAWHVDIGGAGRILDVSGPWTNLHALGRAALRPVGAVFTDLAHGRGIDPDPVPTVAPADAVAPGGATPLHEIAPLIVAIDHVALGFAVMAATAHGTSVVDIVPTYVFSGTTSGGAPVSRELVAVNAAVTPQAPGQ